MNTKFFQMFGKRSLSLKLSAGLKLSVNKKNSELSLRYPHRQYCFPFNPSYELAEVSQVQDFNVYGRSSSLKHEICLMNKRAKFYPNYTHMIINSILENYFDGREFNSLFELQIEIFSNFC